MKLQAMEILKNKENVKIMVIRMPIHSSCMAASLLMENAEHLFVALVIMLEKMLHKKVLLIN
jgi:hypothetical protein